ncbi:hypothetical protein SUGI_0071090 [Cryptomeria japonica]|uniref:protein DETOXIFICATION 27 n=1 Tax=Cryptomeria japonica TaxID=3369 RepID=UPI002408998F|nr:protein DETOXIFICATION 27 [Cryptomeria japonica]GLJ07621.1 hypothetical protein SUGI_0071090 [Cryptomeria japonica]
MEEEGSISRALMDGEETEQIASSDFFTRFCIESKSLWKIAGAGICSRLATLGFPVITQAFVGHIGDFELAAFSIVITVVVGFTSGLLIGMGIALGTLCGQAYGAHREHMLGIYMQCSWIVLIGFAVTILPIYVFTTPLLKLLGQPDDIADLSAKVSLWCIPMHFSFVFYYTLNRFLQSQSKNFIAAWSSTLGAFFNIILCWLLISKWSMGLYGALISLNIAWWTTMIIQYVYVTCGWCPDTWKGYSKEAFVDIWPFLKLSTASGVMLCLEIWYYRVLVLMTGNLKDVEVVVDSLPICLNIKSWEMAIPLAFLASTSVRVGNELGAGKPKRAKFSVIVSTITSATIGLALLTLILALQSELAKIFTDSVAVQNVVYKLAILLAFTIMLNSIQPVLIGVTVGLERQVIVAYINIVCYYMIGVPFGFLLGNVFHLGVKGIWLGMICGTGVQTFALMFIVWRTDWHMKAKTIASNVDRWSSTKVSEGNEEP